MGSRATTVTAHGPAKHFTNLLTKGSHEVLGYPVESIYPCINVFFDLDLFSSLFCPSQESNLLRGLGDIFCHYPVHPPDGMGAGVSIKNISHQPLSAIWRISNKSWGIEIMPQLKSWSIKLMPQLLSRKSWGIGPQSMPHFEH